MSLNNSFFKYFDSACCLVTVLFLQLSRGPNSTSSFFSCRKTVVFLQTQYERACVGSGETNLSAILSSNKRRGKIKEQDCRQFWTIAWEILVVHLMLNERQLWQELQWCLGILVLIRKGSFHLCLGNLKSVLQTDQKFVGNFLHLSTVFQFKGNWLVSLWSSFGFCIFWPENLSCPGLADCPHFIGCILKA